MRFKFGAVSLLPGHVAAARRWLTRTRREKHGTKAGILLGVGLPKTQEAQTQRYIPALFADPLSIEANPAARWTDTRAYFFFPPQNGSRAVGSPGSPAAVCAVRGGTVGGKLRSLSSSLSVPARRAVAFFGGVDILHGSGHWPPAMWARKQKELP